MKFLLKSRTKHVKQTNCFVKIDLYSFNLNLQLNLRRKAYNPSLFLEDLKEIKYSCALLVSLETCGSKLCPFNSVECQR